MSGSARQIDIARLAGVSQTTVSLVLNSRHDSTARIPEETRERVMSAIKRLGYSPNPIARSLKGYRSDIVGLFTFEPIENHPEGFYQGFIDGIVAGCESAGKDLLIFSSTSRHDSDHHIYWKNQNRLRMADGGIMLGNGELRVELARLAREGFPFVFIGKREVDGVALSWVSPDYFAATKRLIDRLVAAGHRSIAYVGVGLSTEASTDRRKAYVAAMAEHGIDPIPPLVAKEGTFDYVDSALNAGVTAFVAEPPVGMSFLVDALAAHGASVPGDVSVALMGDATVQERHRLDWSGYKFPRWDMGRRAVEILMALLAEPRTPPIREEMDCIDVVGTTIAPVEGNDRDA